jgi:predicted metal-dependent hydrolase
MLFDFILKQRKPDVVENFLTVSGRRIPLTMIRNHRARRFLLRLCPDGSVRLTIPCRGSVIEGRRFAERNAEWLGRQLERLSAHPVKPKQWLVGTEIQFRGESVKLEAGVNGESGKIQFSGENVKVTEHGADLRPAIERHLWRLAAKELPPRVLEYATLHQLPVCLPREISVAENDRLHLKTNRKLAVGGRVTNGELVTVKSVRANGEVELTDGRVLDKGYREFLPGQPRKCLGSQQHRRQRL